MVNINNKGLMVTIRCLVYNHEPYLRQCLEGFVMQKTNFYFEAIVHDDASTDGSAEIISEYADKYPDIIKPIFEKENLYSKKDGSLSRVMNEHTHGKYIAMCEGDDYWTDPLKLQKQVDFLEAHPDYAMCWHRCKFYSQYDDKYTINYPEKGFETITSTDFLNGATIPQTLTLVYRRSALDFNNFSNFKFTGDIVLYYMLLLNGKAHCMDDVMGVYRIHNQGVWSGADNGRRFLWEINARTTIYDINPSKETAIYLYNLIKRYSSRSFLIRHTRQLIPIFHIVYKHFGIKVFAKSIVNLYIFKKVKIH